ncbi:MAG: CsbD family protein [Patulibacter minatonensis]
MAGEQDKVAGKVKEKVGAATGNEQLEGEGKGQHAHGKLADAVDSVKDKAAGVAEGIKSAVGGDKDKH